MTIRHHVWSDLRSVLFVLLAISLSTVVHAGDAMRLRGGDIPLRDILIRDLSGGQLVYSDARGRVSWRDLEDIDWIWFGDLPELEEVEMMVREERMAEAAKKLLVLAVGSDRLAAALWLHVLGARWADARRDEAMLSRHLAELILVREDPWWRTLVTLRPTELDDSDEKGEASRTPSIAPIAARDALSRVEVALERVRHPQLRTLLEARRDLLAPAAALAPLPDADVPARSVGERPEPVDESARALEREVPSVRDVELPAEPQPVPSRRASDSPPASERTTRDAPPAAREAMQRAVGEILREAERAGSARERTRALLRAGAMLEAQGRPRDAVLVLLRCGLAYPDEPEAAEALIAAARLYSDQLDNARAAARLAQRALHMDANEEIVKEARALLERLSEVEDR